MIWLAGAGATLAQSDPSGSDTTVFPASHFTAFSPRSALDVVERTPGFVFAASAELAAAQSAFFDPDRSGSVVGTEERFTRRGTSVTLRLSGTF